MDDHDDTLQQQIKSLTDRVMLGEKKIAYLERTVSNRTRHFDNTINRMASEVKNAIAHIRSEFSRLLFTQIAALIFVVGGVAASLVLAIHFLLSYWTTK